MKVNIDLFIAITIHLHCAVNKVIDVIHFPPSQQGNKYAVVFVD